MQRTFTLAICCIVLLSTVALTGCGSDEPATTDTEKQTTSTDKKEPLPEIKILCGSSFEPPMRDLMKEYTEATGNPVVAEIGGSEDHLPKVQLKSTGDVYVTHTPYMQYTRDAEAMGREVPVGFLAPVLVVLKSNPLNIQSVEDLARDDITVSLPDPQYSTCGEMVKAMLLQTGLYEDVNKADSEVHKTLYHRSHGEIGNNIQMEYSDAGIMWNGVANTFKEHIDVVPTDTEYGEEIAISVMGLNYTNHPEAVEAFLDFVEERGPEVFAEYGYTK